MNGSDDKPSRLDSEIFAHRTSREGRVFISWQGRTIKVLRDAAAQEFLRRIDGLALREAQRVMAKATGNFKRGNER